MTLIVLIIYLLVQFIICLYISKKIENESDYLVAGRNFPLSIVSISLFATWFGAETCIGSSAAVFSNGLSGSRADPFGYSLCLFLSGLFIAKRIYNKKYFTLSDFYRDRYGHYVEQMAVWILSLSSLIWAAAQLRAFGQVIAATTSLDLDTTLIIGFLFVLSYTLLGGLMGDMITDVVQAVVIAIGLLILFIAIITDTPNLGDIISQVSPERLSIVGTDESWFERIDRWAIPILGSLVAQEIIARIFAAKNSNIAVKACYIGGAIYISLGLIPVFIGLIGPSLIKIQGDPEQFLIILAKSKLSPIMVGIFSGAVISALLATIDSILLSVSALIGHNFLVPILKVEEPKKKLLISRVVVIAAGLTAFILAKYSTGIYDLLETASSFGTAGIVVITLIGLWTKFGDQKAALSALIIGIITTPIAEYVFGWPSPFLASIAFSTLTYIAFSSVPRSSETI